MGQIVCQTCNETVEFFDAEKVTVLYGKCPRCNGKKDHSDHE